MTEHFMLAPVFITSDHAGYDMKVALQGWLQAIGHKDIHLLGATSAMASDYPDDAVALAKAMEKNKSAMGIAICGSGIGISIALNRHKHIRAALCRDVNDAITARQHNNANVLALAARRISFDTAKDIVKKFQEIDFERGVERHQRRVAMLDR
ncbi:MAG: RpiB/LacA/LacB family sugar-phosphate isomerase [Alphaproteobacteria bacterium]|nr:RpiB/LacA/LacB family sugar-phosphate isomerase [Alphaproteobacteria bacterium]